MFSRLLLALCLAVSASAAAPLTVPKTAQAQAPAARFERDIVPILTANCFKCHGAEVRKDDVDLRTVQAMLKGGGTGPVLVKGSADKSLLYQKIAKKEMPPGKATKLSDAQAALIRDWINAGAQVDQPTVADFAITDKDRQFWAFRAPVRSDPPRLQHTDRVRTPIDAFILAKLEARGLTLSDDAERITLVRRVYFDLLGLPPTPAEVEAFVSDIRPDAYDRLLDRVLASPHYGERWGRHWLDAAGYADTVGTDNDAEIIRVRDGLWRYRDYVIHAFNDDKPYDRFLLEQIAGDELTDWRSAPAYTPEIRDLLTATGFLRTAVDNTTEPELNRLLERYQVLHDTVEIVSSNLLGLTVACARCHDHKFDPIPQADYYRLMACLTPAYNPQNWVQAQNRHLDDISPREKAGLTKHNAEIDRQVGELNRQLAELRRPHEQRLFEAKLAAIPEVLRGDLRSALAVEAAKRNMVEKYLADKLGPLVKVSADEVIKALPEAERVRADALSRQVADLSKKKRAPDKIQALYEVGPAPATHLLRRGNHLNPGPEVQPGFLEVLGNGETAPKPASSSSGRRLALARWLTRPEHPLTARVLVNRVWQHHFGEGIVATPDNFGRSGAKPTHPELLDWLATEFVRGGWKIKPLHRLIMTSTVYRQASAAPVSSDAAPNPLTIDPSNQLLWRMRLRRLESETIRDAVLAVSGKLDRGAGGPPIGLDPRKDGMVLVADKNLPAPTAKWRRSVYLLARRNYQLSLLSVFDQPVVATNCTRRTTSAVPLQALTLMNDVFMLEQADAFAGRVAASGGDAANIDNAFRLAFARPPSARESTWSAELLDKQTQRYQAQKLPVDQARRKALASLCHMLLCTNEFLYVE